MSVLLDLLNSLVKPLGLRVTRMQHHRLVKRQPVVKRAARVDMDDDNPSMMVKMAVAPYTKEANKIHDNIIVTKYPA